MSALWITFYSVRGGVGRSTTLALTALDLARRGHRVAVVDFDLESPGLDILLTPEGKGERDRPAAGVVDFLDARSQGRNLEIDKIIFPRDLPGEYTGRLFLVPAGKCDSSYLAALDRLDLRQMYERSGLLNPVRALRAELEKVLDPDVVLVDSRTGYSDTALVTLFDLADAAVVVMVPDLQNVMRLEPVLERLVKASRKPELLLVANKCQMSSPALRAVADTEERLRALVPTEPDEDEEERPFLHKIAFESSFTWVQRLLPPPVLSDSRQKLGERIHEMVRERNQPPSAPPVRLVSEDISNRRVRLLGRLHFGEDTAETDNGLLDSFLFSPKVRESLRPERWLVRGLKGAGKSSIFRMLTERPDTARENCPELMGWRVAPTHGDPWTGKKYLGAADFQFVRRLIEADKATWKDVWRMYAVAQAARTHSDLATTELRRQAAQFLDAPEEDRPRFIKTLLEAGAHVWIGEMRRLVGEADPGLLFVYDHLDAGFGSEVREFALRREAVTGLLDAWTEDIDPSRPRVLPKIFLREDVFSSLSLANINRWSARDVELRWDFADLVECLARRARRDEELRLYLEEQASSLAHVHPGEARPFVVLFDERVRPWEKQARTWLTASNRLTDVKGNLFPRDFMRLGSEALSLERLAPNERRYFEPSLIAGTHTLNALPKVSERRVRDLKAEFEDYVQLLEGLRGLRSPFDEKDLLRRFELAQPMERSTEERQKLAEEASVRLKEHGVIGDWKDGRLFIPDLYLRGLGMFRAGW